MVFYFDDTNNVRLLTNNEDHLEFFVHLSEPTFDDSFQLISEIERDLEESLKFTFTEKLGYLTSSPFLVGTGLKVSHLLHLPALSLTKEMGKIIKGLSVINIQSFGPHGEGSPMLGNIFSISSQHTLGKSEGSAIKHNEEIAIELIKHEKRAREEIMKHANELIRDKIWRACGLLLSARKLSLHEGLHALSAVRMGQEMGMIKDIDYKDTADLVFKMFPGHIRYHVALPLEEEEIALERATISRQVREGAVLD
jgi:protein arginine kinase